MPSMHKSWNSFPVPQKTVQTCHLALMRWSLEDQKFKVSFVCIMNLRTVLASYWGKKKSKIRNTFINKNSITDPN